MFRLCKPLFAAGLLLIVLASSDKVRAQDGSCGTNGASYGADCDAYGGCGRLGICGRLSAWKNYEPNVTWYAPYPYWWPQYFGPPHTDYLAVQYIVSPAETALMVKERILAINGANPVLLPFSKEPLPFPKGDKQPEKGKEPPLTKLP